MSDTSSGTTSGDSAVNTRSVAEQLPESATLCVCGTRSFMDGTFFSDEERATVVGRALARRFDSDVLTSIDRVVSGGARGADAVGEAWAHEVDAELDVYEAQWDETGHPDARVKERADGSSYDANAGFRRNSTLVDEADLVLAFWDGRSSGTRDTISKARDQLGDERVAVVRYREEDGLLPEPEDEPASDSSELGADDASDDEPADSDEEPESASEGTDDEQTKVVILAGEDAWTDRTVSEVGNLIELALRRFQLEPDVVGVPNDGNGSTEVRDWWSSEKAEGGSPMRLKTFYPESPKHDRSWTELTEQERGQLFGSLESHEIREMFQARDEAMMMWATHVLVVEDGQYVGSTLSRCPEVGGPIVKTFINDDEEFVPAMAEDEEGDADDVVSYAESVVGDGDEEDPSDVTDEAGWSDWKTFNEYEDENDQQEGGRPGDNTIVSEDY